jgi:hypothetical protein
MPVVYKNKKARKNYLKETKTRIDSKRNNAIESLGNKALVNQINL